MCGLASAVTGNGSRDGKGRIKRFTGRHPYPVGGAIVAVIVALLVGVAVWASSGYGTGVSPVRGTCHAAQPVYAGTDPVGTWDVTLRIGQRVNLPDGDTATCTPHGLDVF